MIFKTTILNVSDNSGARSGKCLHIYNNKKYGKIGDFTLISVKTYNTKKKIKKGEMFLSLIIRMRFFFKFNASYIRFDGNSLVLLSKKKIPLGTRLFGPSIIYLRLINRKTFLMLPYII